MSEPTRPQDVPRVGLTALARGFEQNMQALILHRHDIAPLTQEEIRCHSLAALAQGTALARRSVEPRWMCAAAALSAGATHDDVAAATGLGADELCAGLRQWAAEQLRFGMIDESRHAEVFRLAGGAS